MTLGEGERQRILGTLNVQAPRAVQAATQGDIQGFNAIIDPYREILPFPPAQNQQEMLDQVAVIRGMSEGFENVASSRGIGQAPERQTQNIGGILYDLTEYNRTGNPDDLVALTEQTQQPGTSLVLADGTRLDIDGGSGSGGMDLTQSQGQNYGYGIRAQDSDALLTQFESAGLNFGESLADSAPMGVGNYLVSPEYQQYSQAARDFINATLRRESGAVISDDEFANARRQYLPVPGDGPEVLAQKRRNRQNVIQSMIVQSGPAAGLMGGRTAPEPQPGGADIGEVPRPSNYPEAAWSQISPENRPRAVELWNGMTSEQRAEVFR
jgi:hypothetical protein